MIPMNKSAALSYLSLMGVGAAVSDPQPNTSNAAEPLPASEPVQSRQVRRFLARKGPRRQDTFYMLGGLLPRNGGRSKYMPHIGAKERGRYA